MTVNIKATNRIVDGIKDEDFVCDYADVTVKESKMRNGMINREVRVKPEGCKRAKVFNDAVYTSIVMYEATTGRRMLAWER